MTRDRLGRGDDQEGGKDGGDGQAHTRSGWSRPRRYQPTGKKETLCSTGRASGRRSGLQLRPPRIQSVYGSARVLKCGGHLGGLDRVPIELRLLEPSRERGEGGFGGDDRGLHPFELALFLP